VVGLGAVEVVALDHVHAHFAEHQQGLAVFHELGNGLLPHAVCNLDDGAHEYLVVAFQRQVADEHAVDLEDVGLQVLEVGERREPGAEIVQADRASGAAQRGDEARGIAHVGHRRSLGQLH